MIKLWETIRREIPSWFWTVGGIFTLIATLREIIELTSWLNFLIEHWSYLLVAFWDTIFFFVPGIGVWDASFLTFIVMMSSIVFSARNLTGIKRKEIDTMIPIEEMAVLPFRLGIVIPYTIIMTILAVGAYGFKQSRSALNISILIHDYLMQSIPIFGVIISGIVSVFIFSCIWWIPMLISGILALFVNGYTVYYVRREYLYKKLMQIVVGIISLLIVNAISLEFGRAIGSKWLSMTNSERF